MHLTESAVKSDSAIRDCFLQDTVNDRLYLRKHNDRTRWKHFYDVAYDRLHFWIVFWIMFAETIKTWPTFESWFIGELNRKVYRSKEACLLEGNIFLYIQVDKRKTLSVMLCD